MTSTRRLTAPINQIAGRGTAGHPAISGGSSICCRAAVRLISRLLPGVHRVEFDRIVEALELAEASGLELQAAACD